ncbi:hypothetical protein AVEN_121527-1, partial [Araneus ventricosus]
YHEGWFVRRANPAIGPELPVPQGAPNNADVPNEFENNENEHHLVNQDLGANPVNMLIFIILILM